MPVVLGSPYSLQEPAERRFPNLRERRFPNRRRVQRPRAGRIAGREDSVFEAHEIPALRAAGNGDGDRQGRDDFRPRASQPVVK